MRDAAWYPLGIAHAARDLDVLHCTTMRVPLRARPPVVVTVHDAAVLRHPEAFPAWHRHTGRLALRQAVRSADAIVAVSAFTRDELGELLGVPHERVRVVGNGVDPVFTTDGPVADGDYVLAVGTLEPRKNLARVRRGRATRRRRAAGRRGAEAGVASTLPGGWVGPTTPSSPRSIAGRAASSSRRCTRGSGFPILEAMACGTPVVTSRGGATEEVAGGAAVLVDPLDPEAIAAGIAEAGQRRDELVALGRARARAFTWERAADEVEALWRELA